MDDRLKRKLGLATNVEQPQASTFAPYGVVGALVAGGVVLVPVSVVSCLQPTSAKQAASVSNAISFIFELCCFPMCERPGLLGRLALSRRTFTHCFRVAKTFFHPDQIGFLSNRLYCLSAPFAR